MKRVFLAIRFSGNAFLEQYINDIQSNLMAERIKWVEAKNLHLTLKFFGPTEKKQLEMIQITLDKALKSQEKLQISFNKLGVFGSKYQPRVLWMGMENFDDIVKLQKQIAIALEDVGIYADRQNFVPHLTIARIKQLQSKKYFQSVVERFKEFDSEPIIINRIYLYESILRKAGPEYRVLSEYKLQ
jgi:2'-5' RNA ligase